MWLGITAMRRISRRCSGRCLRRRVESEWPVRLVLWDRPARWEWPDRRGRLERLVLLEQLAQPVRRG